MPENPWGLPPELLSLVEKRAEEDRREGEEGNQTGDPAANLPAGKERRRAQRRAEDREAGADG